MPTDFKNATVVFFQGRQAETTARFIRSFGRPLEAPAVCEVPVADEGPLRRFREDLTAGRVDQLILLSGIGARMLLGGLDDAARAALSQVRVLARGPKTVEALAEFDHVVTALEVQRDR